jgi:hypothetical protein
MGNKQRITEGDSDVVRITATVSREQERRLKALAAHSKLSVAWLVREAIDRMLADPEPITPMDPRESKQ